MHHGAGRYADASAGRVNAAADHGGRVEDDAAPERAHVAADMTAHMHGPAGGDGVARHGSGNVEAPRRRDCIAVDDCPDRDRGIADAQQKFGRLRGGAGKAPSGGKRKARHKK